MQLSWQQKRKTPHKHFIWVFRDQLFLREEGPSFKYYQLYIYFQRHLFGFQGSLNWFKALILWKTCNLCTPINNGFSNTWFYSTFLSVLSSSITMEMKSCKKTSGLGDVKEYAEALKMKPCISTWTGIRSLEEGERFSKNLERQRCFYCSFYTVEIMTFQK